MMDRSTSSGNRQRKRGVSLAETLVSMLIVSGLLVSALNTLGAVKWGYASISDRAKGQLLGLELIDEILEMEYAEPVDTPLMGREAGETDTSRAAYDDVDDYHNWTASPPQDKTGTDLPGWDGWSRTVKVQYVQKNNVTLPAISDQGVKRITVTVSYQNKTEADLIAVRTGAAQTPTKISAGETK